MASDANKPAYRDRYPCAACRTGYLDCAAGAVVSLQCCKDCDGHPDRFALGVAAYTEAEYADMKRRAETVENFLARYKEAVDGT